MILDLVDMTTAYVQYLILIMRIYPYSFPAFLTDGLEVMKYFVLDLFDSVKEADRSAASNPLHVVLPDWLPLDIRLQFVLLTVVAPLALFTLGTLAISTKPNYIWLVLTVSALFCFVFGSILVARPTLYAPHHTPNGTTGAILLSTGLPLFVLLFGGGGLLVTRLTRRRLRQEEEARAILRDEEVRYQAAHRLTRLLVAQDNLSLDGLTAERWRQQQRRVRRERLDPVDLALQLFLTAILLVAGLIGIGVIPVPHMKTLQKSKVVKGIGGGLLGVAGLAAVWALLGCARPLRSARVAISVKASSIIFSLVLIGSSFLYTSMVTNLVSILYCGNLVCDAGQRFPHTRSFFPVAKDVDADSASVTAWEHEGYMQQVSVGCITCAVQNFTQQCAPSFQQTLCLANAVERRLIYDARVPCHLVDGFYRASGILMSGLYLLFIPLMQFSIARYAVNVVQYEFPMEQRLRDSYPAREFFYEKQLKSRNKAASIYRAYKSEFRYYRLSFLLQKLILACVSCLTREGLRKDMVWIGLMCFIIIPLIALASSVICRPFYRPTEAMYFPVLQGIVAFVAMCSLISHQLKRALPRGFGIFLVVLVIVAPLCTLVVGTVLTLRRERLRYDRLRARLAAVFATRLLARSSSVGSMAAATAAAAAEATAAAAAAAKGDGEGAAAAAAAAMPSILHGDKDNANKLSQKGKKNTDSTNASNPFKNSKKVNFFDLHNSNNNNNNNSDSFTAANDRPFPEGDNKTAAGAAATAAPVLPAPVPREDLSDDIGSDDVYVLSRHTSGDSRPSKQVSLLVDEGWVSTPTTSIAMGRTQNPLSPPMPAAMGIPEESSSSGGVVGVRLIEPPLAAERDRRPHNKGNQSRLKRRTSNLSFILNNESCSSSETVQASSSASHVASEEKDGSLCMRWSGLRQLARLALYVLNAWVTEGHPERFPSAKNSSYDDDGGKEGTRRRDHKGEARPYSDEDEDPSPMWDDTSDDDGKPRTKQKAKKTKRGLGKTKSDLHIRASHVNKEYPTEGVVFIPEVFFKRKYFIYDNADTNFAHLRRQLNPFRAFAEQGSDSSDNSEKEEELGVTWRAQRSRWKEEEGEIEEMQETANATARMQMSSTSPPTATRQRRRGTATEVHHFELGRQQRKKRAEAEAEADGDKLAAAGAAADAIGGEETFRLHDLDPRDLTQDNAEGTLRFNENSASRSEAEMERTRVRWNIARRVSLPASLSLPHSASASKTHSEGEEEDFEFATTVGGSRVLRPHHRRSSSATAHQRLENMCCWQLTWYYLKKVFAALGRLFGFIFGYRRNTQMHTVVTQLRNTHRLRKWGQLDQIPLTYGFLTLKRLQCRQSNAAYLLRGNRDSFGGGLEEGDDGGGGRGPLRLLRTYWREPTDTMLSAVEVPGSTPPWYVFSSTAPAAQSVAGPSAAAAPALSIFGRIQAHLAKQQQKREEEAAAAREEEEEKAQQNEEKAKEDTHPAGDALSRFRAFGGSVPQLSAERAEELMLRPRAPEEPLVTLLPASSPRRGSTQPSSPIFKSWRRHSTSPRTAAQSVTIVPERTEADEAAHASELQPICRTEGGAAVSRPYQSNSMTLDYSYGSSGGGSGSASRIAMEALVGRPRAMSVLRPAPHLLAEVLATRDLAEDAKNAGRADRRAPTIVATRNYKKAHKDDDDDDDDELSLGSVSLSGHAQLWVHLCAAQADTKLEAQRAWWRRGGYAVPTAEYLEMYNAAKEEEAAKAEAGAAAATPAEPSACEDSLLAASAPPPPPAAPRPRRCMLAEDSKVEAASKSRREQLRDGNKYQYILEQLLCEIADDAYQLELRGHDKKTATSINSSAAGDALQADDEKTAKSRMVTPTTTALSTSEKKRQKRKKKEDHQMTAVLYGRSSHRIVSEYRLAQYRGPSHPKGTSKKKKNESKHKKHERHPSMRRRASQTAPLRHLPGMQRMHEADLPLGPEGDTNTNNTTTTTTAARASPKPSLFVLPDVPMMYPCAETAVSFQGSEEGAEDSDGAPWRQEDAVAAAAAAFLGNATKPKRSEEEDDDDSITVNKRDNSNNNNSSNNDKEEENAANSVIIFLRIQYLLRQRLRAAVWSYQARLKAVQTTTNRRMNRGTSWVLTTSFIALGFVAAIALGLCIAAMLDTVDRSFLTGLSHYMGEGEDSSSENVSLSLLSSPLSFDLENELAGYTSWDNFTAHCCCDAAVGLKASFPYYVVDVEEWLCANGKIKQRIRRDGYDGPERDGYAVRALCGMAFESGCHLHVNVSTSIVSLVGCNDTILVSEGRRW